MTVATQHNIIINKSVKGPDANSLCKDKLGMGKLFQSGGLSDVISLDQKKMATDPCPKEAGIDRAASHGIPCQNPKDSKS